MDRQDYWFSATDEAKGPIFRQSEGPLLGVRHHGDVLAWESLVDTELYPYLADHKIGGGIVFPASGFLEIALEAAAKCLGDGLKEIELLQIHSPLSLETGKSKRLLVQFSEKVGALTIKSKNRFSQDEWSLHASARILKASQGRPVPLRSLPEGAGKAATVSAPEHYRACDEIGLGYGPAFRVVESVTRKGRLAEAVLRESDAAGSFELSPMLLDGAMQALVDLVLPEQERGERAAFVPSQFERILLFRKGGIKRCRIVLTKRSERSLVADFDLLDVDGELIASLRGCRFQRVELQLTQQKLPRYHHIEFVPLRMEGPTPFLPSSEFLAKSVAAFRSVPIDLNAIVGPPVADKTRADGWSQALGTNPGLFSELLLAGIREPQFAGREAPGARKRLLSLLNHAATAREFDRVVERAVRILSDESPPARKLRLLDIGPAEWEPISPGFFDTDRFDYVRPQPSGEGAEPAEFPGGDFDGDASFDIVILRHPAWSRHGVTALLEGAKRRLAPGGRLIVVSYAPGLWQDRAVGGEGPPQPSEWKTTLENAGFVRPAVVPVGAGTFVVAEHDEADSVDTAVATKTSSRHWYIALGSSPIEDAIAQDLAIRLAEAGHHVSFFRDEPSWQVDDLGVSFPFRDPSAWKKALSEKGSTNPCAVIYLNGLSIGEESVESMEAQTLPLACLAQALAGGTGLASPTLVLVTAGAQTPPPPMAAKGSSRSPHQAAVWGFARVLRNEYPDWKCRTIDLHESLEELPSIGVTLAAEILQLDDEDEVIRGTDRRLGLRIRPGREPQESFTPSPCMKLVAGTGGLGGLSWRAAKLPQPRRGEIQIEVRATGLNFRDVMYSLGALPDEALEDGFAGATLGMEGSGVVSAVGPGATKYAVGDKVFFFAPASFATHVVTPAGAAGLIPSGLDFLAAATIPAAFFTVTYALGQLARLRKGERVLIHGAAGGVGLAAIQYARSVGAEVFATVGQQEKRDMLSLIGVPRDRIFDSRSLSFSDDVLAATNGQGVDVVLNSLAGEAVQKGLALLRPFGRFLELGKRDFYANTLIGLRPFRNNITYFSVDADRFLKADPRSAGRIFRDMTKRFSNGSFTPLPFHVFRSDEVIAAFRQMQQGQHMGKILVSPPVPAGRTKPIAEEAQPLDAKSAYLVTGGSGGFGLATAEALARMGARKLILVGRNFATDAFLKTAGELSAQGVELETKICDLADPAALRELVRSLQASERPLRGVIHAAADYDDRSVAEMTLEQFRKVIAAKAGAAIELRRLLRDEPLDFLAFYSSVTVALGNPGQAGYVAANAVVEALALADSGERHPSIALAWGAIGDVGHLARRTDLRKAFEERIGIKMISSTDALNDLGRLLGRRAEPSASSQVLIGEMDWSAPALHVGCGVKRHARFRDLAAETGDETSQDGDFRALIAKMSREEVSDLTLELLARQIGEVLGIAPDKLDRHRPITELGMDSLTGIELRMLIEKKFGFDLPAMTISEGASVSRLAERVTDFLLSPVADESGNGNLMELCARHGESLQTADVAGLAEINGVSGSKVIHAHERQTV